MRKQILDFENIKNKKMFFTAIALVAFSATSMANTVEVEEVENGQNIARRTPTLCEEASMVTYEMVIDNGGSAEAASAFATISYHICEYGLFL